MLEFGVEEGKEIRQNAISFLRRTQKYIMLSFFKTLVGMNESLSPVSLVVNEVGLSLHGLVHKSQF